MTPVSIMHYNDSFQYYFSDCDNKSIDILKYYYNIIKRNPIRKKAVAKSLFVGLLYYHFGNKIAQQMNVISIFGVSNTTAIRYCNEIVKIILPDSFY